MPTAGSSVVAGGMIGLGLIIALIIVVNILIWKFIAWIVTHTVLDVLEKRGYGKGSWRR